MLETICSFAPESKYQVLLEAVIEQVNMDDIPDCVGKFESEADEA
jgi:hypothetical protein